MEMDTDIPRPEAVGQEVEALEASISSVQWKMRQDRSGVGDWGKVMRFSLSSEKSLM